MGCHENGILGRRTCGHQGRYDKILVRSDSRARLESFSGMGKAEETAASAANTRVNFIDVERIENWMVEE